MNDKQLNIIDVSFKLFMRHGYQKVTMSDIAKAAEVSRPTLYSFFPNKESIFAGQVKRQIEANDLASQQALKGKKSLRKCMEVLFEIWIVAPYLSIVDSENGRDLLLNGVNYAPDAIDSVYRAFEQEMVALLKAWRKSKAGMSSEDLAQIMTLATRGLKSSVKTAPDLERLIEGLITMALATLDER